MSIAFKEYVKPSRTGCYKIPKDIPLNAVTTLIPTVDVKSSSGQQF